MRILKPVTTALLATFLAVATATVPTAAFELRNLFKGKQFDTQEVSIDGTRAARMLSDYRKRHGLGPVSVDPTLSRIAADHALRMASAGKLAHVVRGEGSFAKRLRTGGYDAAIASENIGGGYETLELAFAGWRKSKPHNKNMLTPEVTVMGIGRADSAGGEYRTYWSLVLARPYVPAPNLPTAPSAMPGGSIFGG